MTTITCPNCQKEIHYNPKFCPDCGTKLINDTENISRQPENRMPPNHMPGNPQAAPQNSFASQHSPVPGNQSQNDAMRSVGFGVTGFVLAICSLLLVFSVNVHSLGIFLSVLAIVFSGIGLGRNRKARGLAAAGLAISIFLLLLFTGLNCSRFLNTVSKQL